MIRIFPFLLPLLMIHCMSSLHQFHSSDPLQPQSLDSQRKIIAEAEQFVFLGLVFDTKYIDNAIQNLYSQCEKGSIDRIDSVFKTKLGFLSWKNQILLTGYCIDRVKK
jgi:hypothetical protein